MMMMHNFFGDNLFDNENWPDTSFDREFFAKMNPLYGKHAKDVMLTDVKKTEDQYEVIMDLPGFKKDQIRVELENGYLTISATKGANNDEQNKEGKYIRRERYAGAMQRSFYVGDAVTQEDIKAKFEDGIL